MRRWLPLVLFALAAAVATAAASSPAVSAPRSGDRGSAPIHGRGASYFAVVCGFSHRNFDDPIVYPRKPGLSHNHTYFGNRSTNASSTPASLRAAGRTSCRLPADTAAYWAPTLYVGKRAIEPVRATVFYVRRTFDSVDPFPAGLKMIAGDAMARKAQSQRVTFWSCGFYGGVERSSTVPTCPDGSALHLHVMFPNCWDGRRLDSADHKAHMAYSVQGSCPQSHAVEVPAIFLVIRYPVAGSKTAELASGGQFSGHADFVNAWNQDVLETLVDRYLNGFGYHHGGHGGYHGRR